MMLPSRNRFRIIGCGCRSVFSGDRDTVAAIALGGTEGRVGGMNEGGGFTYPEVGATKSGGTLPGHPERGVESFIVEWDGPEWDGPGDADEATGGAAGEADRARAVETGAVWLTVRAFSVGAKWYTRAAGPLVPLLQHSYACTCGVVLRRLTAQGSHSHPAGRTGEPDTPTG